MNFVKFQILVVAAMTLASGPVRGAEKNNEVPAEVDDALRTASTSVLYSLEPLTEPNPPGPKLHQYKILGQTKLDQNRTASAVTAFRTAISHWDGMIAAALIRDTRCE
jgi:hypothetical protein